MSASRTSRGKRGKNTHKILLARIVHIFLRMNKTANIKNEQGSMMMEYVIVLCGIGIALMIFMNREFYSVKDGFGPLGQGIVALYQRTLGGLSLPVP